MRLTQITDIIKNTFKKLAAITLATAILSCFSGSTRSLLSASADTITLNAVTIEANVKVRFPEGQNIMTTYDLGMPLAAEKALLEPDFFGSGR